MENLTLKEAIKLQRKMYNTIIICAFSISITCLFFVIMFEGPKESFSEEDVMILEILRMMSHLIGVFSFMIFGIFYFRRPEIPKE